MQSQYINGFQIIKSVDQIPEIRGIGIYLVNDVSQQCSVLRPAQNTLINCALVIEINVVQKRNNFSSMITAVKTEMLNEKTGALKPFYKELGSMALNCSAAYASGTLVLGSAAAAVPSAGASLVVTVLSWTAFVTSAAECVDSGIRSVVVVKDLFEQGKTRSEIETLERWDKNTYYTTSMDAIGKVGTVASVTSLGLDVSKRVISLKADKLALSQMQKMKGGARLEPFRQRFGSTSIFRNKAENEAIAKALEAHRKGVGDRIIKKMLQSNKKQITELTLKKFLTDIKEIIKDNFVDMTNYATKQYFERNKTLEVNCHFVEIY
jgi:hypothetical protein